MILRNADSLVLLLSMMTLVSVVKLYTVVLTTLCSEITIRTNKKHGCNTVLRSPKLRISLTILPMMVVVTLGKQVLMSIELLFNR